MLPDIFLITPLDVLSWITFGFVVGLLVHTVRPTTTPRHIYKDIILATLGSMVGGLTIVFFYGYTLLGILTVSIVGGLILASGYIWVLLHRSNQMLNSHVRRI